MSNKKWFRIDYKTPAYATERSEHRYETYSALCEYMTTSPATLYEVHEASPEEVPPAQRFLCEATTEALRDELQKRGWKVTA